MLFLFLSFYDDLLGKFGQSRPAVGFAFSLNRVLLALEAQKGKKS
jgi:histidyl-tRNA synthetase